MTSAKVIAVLVIVGLVILVSWQNHKDREGLPRELLEAAKGNKKLAKRLLANAKERIPGKSDRWYVEKVIYDLERDGAGGRRKTRSLNSMSRREMRETFFLVGAFAWMISAISNLFR